MMYKPYSNKLLPDDRIESLKLIFRKKLKRGYPVKATNYHSGFMCLVNNWKGNILTHDVVNFNLDGKLIGTHDGLDISNDLYIERKNKKMCSVVRINEGKISEFRCNENCQVVEDDFACVDNTLILSLSTGTIWDMTNSSGHVFDCIRVRDRLFVHGAKGIAIIQIDNVGLRAIEMPQQLQRYDYYNLSLTRMFDDSILVAEWKDGHTTFVLIDSYNYKIQSTTSKKMTIFASGSGTSLKNTIAPINRGFIVHGREYDKKTNVDAYHKYDFTNGKWIRMTMNPDYFYTQRIVSSDGHIVLLHDNAAYLFDSDLFQKFKYPMPDPYPYNVKAEITAIMSNGIIVVAHGKLHHTLDFLVMK